MKQLIVPGVWTKETESQFLDDLMGLFKGTDTYLKELFSPDMVIEISNRITNDFPCDLYGSYTEAVAHSNTLEQTIKEQKDALELLGNVVATLTKERDEARGGLTAAQQTISDLKVQVEDQQVDLGVRDFRIVELKAKLYDMEHPQQ